MVTGKKRLNFQNFALIMCVAIFFVFIVLSPLLLLLPIWLEKRAYGDGLAQEQISSSLGNRKADLLIKMTPPVITDETLQKGQNPVVEFRLFDSNTNNSFSHVTYYITIEKDGKKLLSNWFHAHNGDLVMEIKPSRNAITTTTNSVVNIAGQQEPLLGSYIGTTNDPVIVTGPIFLNSGLYHFIVRIATVDSDTGVLPADQQRIYESWFSIGNTKHEQIDIDGKNIPIKIVSYYDRLNNFTFDNKSKQMQFDMPFNWDTRRLNNTSIFVHEEIYVPKPNAFTANKSLSGTVNGINVSKDIMIDPSQPDKDVIHVMLPKDTIIQLANQVNKNGVQVSSGLMKFALNPTSSNNATTTMGGGGGGGMMSGGSMGNMSMSSGSMANMSMPASNTNRSNNNAIK